MKVIKLCTACNIDIDSNNHLKDRTVCKSCYNIKRRKNKNNTLIKKQQPEIDNVNNNNNNRTLIIGFSNCGKTYLMNHVLRQKQEPIFKITETLNQYPITKAHPSDEIQPLENYENSIFEDMLLLKQESNIDLFITQNKHQSIDIYYISQCYFHLPINTIRKMSNIFI